MKNKKGNISALQERQDNQKTKREPKRLDNVAAHAWQAAHCLRFLQALFPPEIFHEKKYRIACGRLLG